MKKYGFDKIPELKTDSEKKVEVKEVDKEVEKLRREKERGIKIYERDRKIRETNEGCE